MRGEWQPRSLQVTLESPGKTDLEPQRKQQAGVGGEGGRRGEEGEASHCPARGEGGPAKKSNLSVHCPPRGPQEERPQTAARPPFPHTEPRGEAHGPLSLSSQAKASVITSPGKSLESQLGVRAASPLGCSGCQHPGVCGEAPEVSV